VFSLLAASKYFDEKETNRRAPPAVVELNDHTCAFVNLDDTDDLEATLALCHYETQHRYTPSAEVLQPLRVRGTLVPTLPLFIIKENDRFFMGNPTPN
jgi:hypothetical protein